MIKQIFASALLVTNAQNIQIQNASNLTNITYSYNIANFGTASTIQIDNNTILNYVQKTDTNTYVTTKTKQYNFITESIDNTDFNVIYRNNNYVTTYAQTRMFLYMELYQSLNNNIADNVVNYDLRSSIIQLEPQTITNGMTPKFDYKIYYTYDNEDISNIFNNNPQELNSHEMLENITNVYNKTTIKDTYYNPTVNSWDQIEDNREGRINIPILNNKTTQLIVCITPLFATNDESTEFVTLNTNPAGVIYQNDTITINGTAQVVNNNIEVIDMPNVMWQILTMPFSFISVAFNLTLWPNTPYAVDLGSLILALLGILIFIFIMKIIIKAAAKG